MSTIPEQAAAEPPARNTPRIAEFEVEDGTPNYFVLVEQSVLCQASSFCNAVFYWFSAHYVFNLEYNKHVKELALFFHEFVLDRTSKQLQEDVNVFSCHHRHPKTHHVLSYCTMLFQASITHAFCMYSCMCSCMHSCMYS